MTKYYEARAAREEAQVLALAVGGKRAALAMTGQRDAELDEAAERLADVLVRAGAVEAAENEPQPVDTPVVAAMEWIDPDEFGRKVRARRRMAALRRRKPVMKAEPEATTAAVEVTTKVVRRG